jgi:hypothetical protein
MKKISLKSRAIGRRWEGVILERAVIFFAISESTTPTCEVSSDAAEHLVLCCRFLLCCTIYLEHLSFVPLFGCRWT